MSLPPQIGPPLYPVGLTAHTFKVPFLKDEGCERKKNEKKRGTVKVAAPTYVRTYVL